MEFWQKVICFSLIVLFGMSDTLAQESKQMSPTKLRYAPDHPKKDSLLFLLVLKPDLTGKAILDSFGQVLSQQKYVWLRTTQEDIQHNPLFKQSLKSYAVEDFNPIEESRVLDLNLNPNQINLIHDRYADLDGRGEIISIKEFSFDTTDIDLLGRIRFSPRRDSIVSQHATNMATIIGGLGNSSIKGRGVAQGVAFVSTSFGDLLPDPDSSYQGIFVQNHAYGTSIENFYGGLAEAYDEHSYQEPTFLHLFSAGNQGDSSSRVGTYQNLARLANLTGNFKHAKNVLTIGAIDHLGQIQNYSSRGPAYDGRIKPELVAYSQNGTSNAVSLVAGLSVMLQQAYREQQNRRAPSALIKALLINTAKDVGPPGPDYYCGFGDVRGLDALESLFEERFVVDSLMAQENKVYDIAFPAGVKKLKVTLVWTDSLSPDPSLTALYNDLDISLQLDGQSYLPWTLNPHPDSLALFATRGEDHLNNMEQISISLPPNQVAGNVKIQISGQHLQGTKQVFALAYQWTIAEQVEWSYPSARDNMPYDGESITELHWQSSMAADSGLLQYRLLPDGNWLELAKVKLDDEQWTWQAPEVFSKAQLRLVVGNQTFESDTFVISYLMRPGVGVECDEDLILDWAPVEGAVSYQLWSLEETILQEKLSQEDSFIVLSKADFPIGIFAVEPILADGGRGIRSYAFDYRNLAGRCYIEDWYAEGLQSEGVYLNLRLGAILGIKELVFERMEENEFRVLGSSNPAIETQFVDPNPMQGLNQYRARLLLEDGQTITSQISNTYYLAAPSFLVFPNPVSRNDLLSIYSQKTEEETQLLISNLEGRVLYNITLNSEREAISLYHLSPGIYYYRLLRGGERLSGKLSILP